MKHLISTFCLAYSRHHYATFFGRATREEFWTFAIGHFLFVAVLNAAASDIALLTVLGSFTEEDLASSLVFAISGDIESMVMSSAIIALVVCGIFYAIFVVFSIIPGLSITVRRYHDVGLSGLWLFVTLIGPILLFVVGCFHVLTNYVDPLIGDIDPKSMLDVSSIIVMAPFIAAQILSIMHFIILCLPSKTEANEFVGTNEDLQFAMQ